MGIEHMKKCKKCGKIFDIGTNYDLCPDCRTNSLYQKINLRKYLRNKQEGGRK